MNLLLRPGRAVEAFSRSNKPERGHVQAIQGLKEPHSTRSRVLGPLKEWVSGIGGSSRRPLEFIEHWDHRNTASERQEDHTKRAEYIRSSQVPHSEHGSWRYKRFLTPDATRARMVHCVQQQQLPPLLKTAGAAAIPSLPRRGGMNFCAPSFVCGAEPESLLAGYPH